MRAWLIDTVERVVATWVEAFIGFLLAANVTNIGWSLVECAAWSAVPAALAVLKAAVASRRATLSPASLVGGSGTRSV